MLWKATIKIGAGEGQVETQERSTGLRPRVRGLVLPGGDRCYPNLLFFSYFREKDQL